MPDPYLVIVLDKADGSGAEVLVMAEDEDDAADNAIEKQKSSYGLAEKDGDCGFKVIAILGLDQLEDIVERMRRKSEEQKPDPDDPD